MPGKARHEISRDTLIRLRANASHLAVRVPKGALVDAAWGGVQDSAPRSGVLSLHARVDGVRPDSWEDPALVQVWGPRLAVYIVAERDVDVFTSGRLPRDDEQRKRLETVAQTILDVLKGRVLKLREAAKAMPSGIGDIGIRSVGATGLVRVRWDGSGSFVVPGAEPKCDPEDARRELARRFLHWLGPSTPDGFARWAGIGVGDANETWRGIERELVEVSVEGGRRWILSSDEAYVRNHEPISGVRFVPSGDPYLFHDRGLLVPKESQRRILWPQRNTPPRLPNATTFIPGALLVDGEIAGFWGRRQARVHVASWCRLDQTTTDLVADAASNLSGPLGRDVTLHWFQP